MKHSLAVSIHLAAALCAGAVLASAPKTKPVQQMEQNTRIQIFLDNANFGPGKIDGQQGEFTRKAIALFRQSKGLPADSRANAKGPIDTTGLDLSGVDPVFVDYTVTAEDVANVGELPTGPAAQAKVKRLPYATVAEAVAEKFHCALAFLTELNPGKTGKLKAGDKVGVPNVKPFELSAVKGIEPGSDAKAVVANELGDEQPAATAPGDAPDPAAKKSAAPALSVHVSVKDEMLEVRDGDKVVAAFPVTVGSQQTVSPVGTWKVQGVAKMPNFRYDPKMLKHGERGTDFHMLPPGPNDPVGVIWIALNKKGIGIHGTNDPDSIGRSASHGCIRLANWDIVKLAAMVKAGDVVIVE